MAQQDIIGITKTVLWEEAKGKLRTVAALSGQHPSNVVRHPIYTEVEKAVEKFIKSFEAKGYHE